MAGDQLSEIADLKSAGACAISDDAFPIQNAETMRRGMEYCAQFGMVLMTHNEDKALTVGGAMNEGYTATVMGVPGIPRVAEDIAVARNILNQLYPEPNTAGSRQSSNGQTINNYLINPTLERQDNQFDVKVDHNLTTANRFFVRYSYEKTHRVLPATLPHGDAGFTFGAGDGNIKAQGLAFNDTHTFSANWLNEARFGISSRRSPN